METYREHHTSLAKGYISTKAIEGVRSPYSGRFGEGYTIRRNNPQSTRYCLITYYIAE